ncbi:hypothetical protein AB205_0060200 [Aquarana catesbeiana]|uniref:protein-tyrosine-phosphatase n=1 Tax=Aquarana catesbeiana TaxID=8400 RepID=A0A2G9SAE8_AQUCT|nr:hypothetical protein AB205_0060200 [Aquarana catesbeiana]
MNLSNLDPRHRLELTAESREIFHFHYTTWPDFGVPESPASFLNFLIEVRNSGSLDPNYGPSVVHCSAGIGRSGTFSLVDTCLVLNPCTDISKDDQSDKVDSKQTDERYNGNRLHTEEEQSDDKSQEADSDAQSTLRKRVRDIRKANTAQKVQQMRQKMTEVELKRKRWLFWKPFLIPVGLASALVLGVFLCWKIYSP